MSTTREPSERDLQIAAIAQNLGYVPNPNAASLTTKRSQSVGVLVPQLTDVVLSRIYDAIEAAANAAGLETFVANTHDEPSEQRRRIVALSGRSVDGLIIGDARLDDDGLQELTSRRVPVVLVSRRYRGLLSSTLDDVAGGRIVAEHLADLGHTRVGIISGPTWTSTGIDRRDGFLDVFRKRGIDVPDELVEMGGFDVAFGRQAADRLFALHEPPTAIFAANDDAAVGVLGALRDRQLEPGRDVALVGFNDIPICRELTVPLSSVRSDHAEIGRRAIQILLAAMHGLPVSSSLLQPELVVRESSGPR
jgi:LacI family transcriptional regulator